MKLLSLLFTTFSTTSLVSALISNSEGLPQDISDVICTGRPRSTCAVELDVPHGCEETDSNCPIVFFLHGSGGTNRWFKNTSGVHSAGYIGIYPNGEGGWSTGPKSSDTCQWDDFECTTDPDEGDFIASIIQEVRDRGANGNIYAIGNSNGAALAHRLASNADSSLPIKGIVAKVTQLLKSPERSGPGTLNYNQPSSVRGSHKVSVLSIMGTEDGLIPYEGGSSSVFGGNDNFQLMSAMESMNTWAIHNGCSGEYEMSSHVSDQGDLTATKYTYGSCPSDVIVEHYAMNGAGHNAGGASIDGEKIDYVIAYDFIQRLENSSSGPTSPVASPVASPTSTLCFNDPTWSGKFNSAHTCEYIAENPSQRCGWENVDGGKASEACKYACDEFCSTSVYSPTASPVTSPVVSPVASPPTTVACVDDSMWAGKFNAAHTCDYVSQNPEQRCGWENNEGVKASDACLLSCGNCNVDTNPPMTPSPSSAPVISPTSTDCNNDSTWAGKFNAAHTCDYVAENPSQRCTWESVDGVKAMDACPLACNTNCEGRRTRFLRG